MPKILINTFATEKEAKDFFASVVESESIKGAFVLKSGKVFVTGTADPVVSENKFIVMTSSADIVSDKDK